MKKALSAFGVLGAALVLLTAPVSAQAPGNITATITAAPSSPTAGTQILVTAVFSIPSLSTTPAEVSISTSGGGTPALVSFTPGLSSCVTTTDSVKCTWSTPDSAAPQTLVVEVPATASGITFNANAGPPGQAHLEGHDVRERGAADDHDRLGLHDHCDDRHTGDDCGPADCGPDDDRGWHPAGDWFQQ